MEEKSVEKRPIAPVLREMETGQVEIFPASQYSCISVSTARVGMELGRKYKMRAKRDERIVEVTRLS